MTLEELRQKLIKETPDVRKDIKWLDYCREVLQKHEESIKKNSN